MNVLLIGVALAYLVAEHCNFMINSPAFVSGYLACCWFDVVNAEVVIENAPIDEFHEVVSVVA